MHWFTACLIYVMVWWMVLFVVLPIGTHPEADPDPATGWRGTPARPMIGRKLLATTLISVVLWGVILYAIQQGWVSFRTGWLAAPDF